MAQISADIPEAPENEAPCEIVPGVGLSKSPFNIGRKKETRIYYRPHTDPDGNRVWIPTNPLPADAWHMMYYTNKGFKLWPPGKEPKAESIAEQAGEVSLQTSQGKKGVDISCPMEGCTKVVHSYSGLARHMNTVHKQK